MDARYRRHRRIANLAALLALSGARSLNERGARAHVLSDLLGSAAATVAALLILFEQMDGG